MEKLEKDFMLLSQYVAIGSCAEKNDWENTDWENVYRLCSINKLIACTYDYVKNLDAVPENLLKKWDQYRFMTFVRQKKCFYSLRDIVQEFTQKNIAYAVFKGNVIAALYQNPYHRITSDSDIYVDERDREVAIQILTEHGYEYVEEESKDIFVNVFFKQDVGHKIELHTSLFENYKGKQIEQLHAMNLTDVSKRIILTIDGVEFTTLGHEEHLIFQMFHFVKHFILEGISIRYLIDITLFINHYFSEISWESFWKKMKKLHYDSFCERLFSLCVKYYGLNPAILPNGVIMMNPKMEESLIMDLIYKGNQNNSRKVEWGLNGNLKGYLEGEKTEVDSSTLHKKVRAFLPNQQELNDYYTYAKKHKYLVPIAWIHRIFHSRRMKWNHSDPYGIKEKDELISEREKMLLGFGLIKEGKKNNE